MTRKARIQALKLLGHSTAGIGQALGISPCTVRYHLRRMGREDGRKDRRRKLDALAPAIEHWALSRFPLAGRGPTEGPAYLRPLHDWPRREHGYGGSHVSVVRHVRRAFPGLRLRPSSRAGAPAGADAWGEGLGPAWALRLLLGTVAEVNGETRKQARRAPLVELVPLPSRAQFLNVIESVFSGMARAIIHNSDSQSVEEAKEAIDRYFRERNDYFTRHPKRAGRRIWGKERAPCRFSEANNCMGPRWRP